MSPIFPADKVLLESALQRVRPESKYYEDSWGYILQATRYGRCKWYDPNTGSLIFFGRRASTLDLVVPLFFATPQYLQSALQEILSVLPVTKVTLKNIPPDDIPDFLPYGFRRYRIGEGWSAKYPLADQTYPQLIIDLKEVAERQGRKYHVLRKALNKQLYAQLRPYQSADREAVMNIFSAVDKQHSIAQSASVGYVETHEMYPDADIEKFVLVDNTGKIIGFTATSKISHTTTALVAALFQPDIKRISTLGTYYTLEEQYKRGFQFANLGGCGSKTLYLYKREKFRPAEEIERTHLVFEK